jgi:hypothetical protein
VKQYAGWLFQYLHSIITYVTLPYCSNTTFSNTIAGAGSAICKPKAQEVSCNPIEPTIHRLVKIAWRNSPIGIAQMPRPAGFKSRLSPVSNSQCNRHRPGSPSSTAKVLLGGSNPIPKHLRINKVATLHADGQTRLAPMANVLPTDSSKLQIKVQARLREMSAWLGDLILG